MEAQIIIIGAEILAIGGREGLKRYLAHRKRKIDEGKEDELISSRIKKFSRDIILRMSKDSRDTTPLKIINDVENIITDAPNSKSISGGIKLAEDVIDLVEDAGEAIEDVYNEEKSEDDDTERKSIAEKILNSQPLNNVKKRLSISGINPSKLISNIRNAITPSRRQSVKFEDQNSEINEFEKFMTKVGVFVHHELQRQKEDGKNHVFLKHNHYATLLVKSLAVQNKIG
jgi:hypothetical protein